MDFVAIVLIVAVLSATVWLVSGPLRRAGEDDPAAARRSARRAELEARRDAKYREIRDTELDWRTGKLSDDDHRALDRALRAEAIEILHELDRLGDAEE